MSDPAHWHLAQYPHSHAHLASAAAEASSTSHATASHWLSSFQDLARELRVDIQVGTIVERAVDAEGNELTREVDVVVDEATGETRRETRPVLENVASYIDWEGNVLHRYKKRNLWWPEKEYLCEGNEDHQVFDTRFGRVGMLICASPSPSASLCLVPNTAGTDLPRALPAAGWDLAWPRAFQSLLLQNVSLVLAPTYWTAVDAGPLGLKHNVHSEADYLKVLIPTRAWDNECAIVVRWPPPLSRLLLAALRSTVHSRAQQGVQVADGTSLPAVHQRGRARELERGRPYRERRGPDRRELRVRAVQGSDRGCGAFSCPSFLLPGKGAVELTSESGRAEGPPGGARPRGSRPVDPRGTSLSRF